MSNSLFRKSGVSFVLTTFIFMSLLVAGQKPALADQSTSLPDGTLPSASKGIGAMYDGHYSYLFGGYNGSKSSSIIRYDSISRTSTMMSAQLPSAGENISAVWNGQYAFLFGGASKNIRRYDPSSDSISTVAAQFSFPMEETSGIYDGSRYIYLLGGYWGESVSCGSGCTSWRDHFQDGIFRYDPVTDTLSTMSSRLPYARSAASAVFDGTNAYLFGGKTGFYSQVDQIVKYTPSTDSAIALSVKLPSARAATSAIFDGQNGYIFGGESSLGTTFSFSNQIVKFDVSAVTAMLSSAVIPSGRGGTGAVWDGSRTLIFGGRTTYSTYSNQVFNFDPIAPRIALNASPFSSAKNYTSSIYDGRYAYSFGGSSSGTEIVRYDPSNNEPKVMASQLPAATAGTAAVWDGSRFAYILGGSASPNQILRYEPSTDTLTVMGATLPFGATSPGAVWDSSSGVAYIFGGGTRRIQKYDPATDSASAMNAQLPYYIYDPNAGYTELPAVFDGTYAYVFGGRRGTWYTDAIVRFDPAADVAVERMGIGSVRWGMSAIWDGRYAILFGGGDSYGRTLSQIARYDPVNNTYTAMSASLPSARANTSAVWTGSFALVFGGGLNQTVRYDIKPGSPLNLWTVRGPASGQIQISWGAPASNTFDSPITAYRLYRGTTSGSQSFLAELSSATLSYLDSDLPNNSTYYYRIAAVNDLGEGTSSNVFAGTTPTMPAAPQYLQTTSGAGRGQILLSWDLPSDSGGLQETKFRLFRGNSADALVFLGEVTQRSYQDTGLADTSTYYYQVSAVNPVGEGPRSPVVSGKTFTTPTNPQTISAFSDIHGTVVQWSRPAGTGGLPITGYRLYIYRIGYYGSDYYYYDVNYSATSYVDYGCTIAQVCYYKVAARNDIGEGPRSSNAYTAGLIPRIH